MLRRNVKVAAKQSDKELQGWLASKSVAKPDCGESLCSAATAESLLEWEVQT
jgi:hypothetical protein